MSHGGGGAVLLACNGEVETVGEDGVRLRTGTATSCGVLFLLQRVDLEVSSARPAARWHRGDAGVAGRHDGGSQAPLAWIWALKGPSRSWQDRHVHSDIPCDLNEVLRSKQEGNGDGGLRAAAWQQGTLRVQHGPSLAC
jgi:hypothetical protein